MIFYPKLAISAALVFGVLGASERSQAQAVTPNLNYSVQYDTDCYNVLEGATLISVNDFLNFTGAMDPDDGTADSIPVGFTFEYNGHAANTINVNVNGWVSINSFNPVAPFNGIPAVPADNNNLFTSILPNNTLAPYWGDHYYRTLEPGYKPTRISYTTAFDADTDRNGGPSWDKIGVFTIEWRDLNIIDKSNPNSVASFQLLIHQNPLARDLISPDQRATIEFRYGIADTGAIVAGASVGIEDSVGFAHLNGLFETSQFNGDSTRLSTARTTCWPPPNCTPCIAIKFIPMSGSASIANPSMPNNFSIYPNPLIQSATIRFAPTESGSAQVTIVNLLGSEVARLFEGNLDAGQHSFTWDSRGAPPGMYECVVRMNGLVEQVPIMLEK